MHVMIFLIFAYWLKGDNDVWQDLVVYSEDIKLIIV